MQRNGEMKFLLTKLLKWLTPVYFILRNSSKCNQVARADKREVWSPASEENSSRCIPRVFSYLVRPNQREKSNNYNSNHGQRDDAKSAFNFTGRTAIEKDRARGIIIINIKKNFHASSCFFLIVILVANRLS